MLTAGMDVLPEALPTVVSGTTAVLRRLRDLGPDPAELRDDVEREIRQITTEPAENWAAVLGRAGCTARSAGTRPDVRTDLRAAAGHSIWHPAAEFRPGWPLHLNTFALSFSLSGDLPAAASVFERLGENVTAYPWGYLGGGNEAKSFVAARKQAFS